MDREVLAAGAFLRPSALKDGPHSRDAHGAPRDTTLLAVWCFLFFASFGPVFAYYAARPEFSHLFLPVPEAAAEHAEAMS